ncbi:MAG: hypothetical protein IH945_08630 [Armatimonadetes bacterium]|nr:hypothetical protein [Armatimonadota bacterium]
MILASAHLAAPMAVDSVNFVHSYEKDQKVTYELYISSEADGIEAKGEFELAINSPLEKGKMKATFTFLKLDMDGNDMSEMMPPIDFELDKHGVPQKSDEDDGSIFAFVSLLATYLPGESLEEGGDFKIKLPDAQQKGKKKAEIKFAKLSKNYLKLSVPPDTETDAARNKRVAELKKVAGEYTAAKKALEEFVTEKTAYHGYVWLFQRKRVPVTARRP